MHYISRQTNQQATTDVATTEEEVEEAEVVQGEVIEERDEGKDAEEEVARMDREFALGVRCGTRPVGDVRCNPLQQPPISLGRGTWELCLSCERVFNMPSCLSWLGCRLGQQLSEEFCLSCEPLFNMPS